MELEAGMTEILDSGRGTFVKCDLPDGEPVVLRRAHNGVQLLFPDRPRREPLLLPDKNQQDEPGNA